jgi:iron complex outermembrane recepter protein
MRATSIIAAAVGAALIGVSAGADAQSARVHTHIPPEALGSALRSLAQDFGFQIVYPSKDIATLRTRGVTGSFTVEQALEQALAGTGLTYRYVDVHTITILPIVRATAMAADDPPAPAPERLALASERHAPQASDVGSTARPVGPPPADPPQAAGAANVTATNSPGAGASPATLQEVVVTGTSIRGGNATMALPVQVLSASDIARTGATTTLELMQNVSAVSSVGSTVPAQGTGFVTGGISTVSLHGLGADRTLVLINGLRSTVYGGNSGDDDVDIGAIPIAAIQDVQILKDGASAVYGSDAIAGVVNFILKSDFQGLEASATVGAPTQAGGGTQESASIYGGLGSLESDRYNIGIGLSFSHSSPLMGYSRSFATRYSPGYGNDVTSSFAFPANVAIPAGNSVYPKGSTRSPMAGDCGPDSLNDVNYPAQCRFDNSSGDSLEPLQKRGSVYVNGGYKLSDSSQLYGNVLFSENQTTQWEQPVPLSYQNPMVAGDPYIAYLANLLATDYPGYKAVKAGEGAFLLPPTSPYYPTAWAAQNGLAGQPLNLIYRSFATGLRQTEDTADTTRVVGGIKGDAAGWAYDTSLLYSGVAVYDNLQSGWAQYSQLMPLLDSGVINPFGPTTDASAAAAAMATNYDHEDYSTRTSLTALDGSASREIAYLPAGPLRMAVGGELRRETYIFSPSPALLSGDIAGLAGNELPESASRTAEAAYIEFSGSITHTAGADLAARWDHYQSVGNTINPQLTLHWQALPWLLLRGAAGTGFRAPSLTDLYAPQVPSVTSNGTRDPIQCAVFNPNNPACSFQFQTLTGGNPNLKPEKSTSFMLGTVLKPVKNLTLDVDSYWIYLRDAITPGGLPYNVILANAANATEFASYITRDSSGNIVFISQTNANLFKTYVSGLDINLQYDYPLGPGYVEFQGNGSYYYTYNDQQFNGTWISQINQGDAQVAVAGGVIVRWRHTLTLGYVAPSWQLSATQNYQEPYHDMPSTITEMPRYVSAYDTLDMQGSYTGMAHFDFTLGVKNLFNQNPPYANYASTTNNFVGGYDLSYGVPYGRYIYATVKYTLE